MEQPSSESYGLVRRGLPLLVGLHGPVLNAMMLATMYGVVQVCMLHHHYYTYPC